MDVDVDERQRASGFDQATLNEAARRGFANGAFEELDDDVPAVVEEFYPVADQQPPDAAEPKTDTLRNRLAEKVAQASPH